MVYYRIGVRLALMLLGMYFLLDGILRFIDAGLYTGAGYVSGWYSSPGVGNPITVFAAVQWISAGLRIVLGYVLIRRASAISRFLVRINTNLCPTCGSEVSGLIGEVCSECGNEIPVSWRSARQQDSNQAKPK